MRRSAAFLPRQRNSKTLHLSKLRSIQVLRGIAATGVVVHHAHRLIDPHGLARVGAAGVDLFFVIYGFIMVTVARDKRPSEFLFARMWRIYPMWLIAVAPWLLIASHDWQTVATSLTLFPIWSGAFHTPALMIGWTLGFEMLFYAAFALALATRPIVPLCLFLVALIIGPRNDLLAWLGSPLILEFLSGAAIAALPSRRWATWLLPIGLAWFAIAPLDIYTSVFGHPGFNRIIAWGVPSALIVASARQFEAVVSRAAFDFPVLIGEASFSIYLFHRLIVLGILPWPVEVLLSLALGIAAYWFLERKIIALKPDMTTKRIAVAT